MSNAEGYVIGQLLGGITGYAILSRLVLVLLGQAVPPGRNRALIILLISYPLVMIISAAGSADGGPVMVRPSSLIYYGIGAFAVLFLDIYREDRIMAGLSRQRERSGAFRVASLAVAGVILAPLVLFSAYTILDQDEVDQSAKTVQSNPSRQQALGLDSLQSKDLLSGTDASAAPNSSLPLEQLGLIDLTEINAEAGRFIDEVTRFDRAFVKGAPEKTFAVRGDDMVYIYTLTMDRVAVDQIRRDPSLLSGTVLGTFCTVRSMLSSNEVSGVYLDQNGDHVGTVTATPLSCN